jgi:hypothetical protein
LYFSSVCASFHSTPLTAEYFQQFVV